MPVNLKGRNFLKELDFTQGGIRVFAAVGARTQGRQEEPDRATALMGKNIALIFEKTSTRTRCAFEVGAFDQGAHVTYLGPVGSQIGHKESMKDTGARAGPLVRRDRVSRQRADRCRSAGGTLQRAGLQRPDR